jgi:hypothetical protein
LFLLTASAVAFAAPLPSAQAASPMMDEPILLSVHGQTTPGFTASKGKGQQATQSYKTYRDRLGYGSRRNKTNR